MGAMEFYSSGKGCNAAEAFQEARGRALHMYGYGGSSGTIAEKSSYKLIPCEQNEEAVDTLINKCLGDMNHFCQDKWGDAGAIQVNENTWIFFGWASS